MTRRATPTGQRIYADLAAFFDDDANPSQAALARELGISTPYLSMIKCREREPDLALAIRIMNRCRVPLESLIQTVPRRRRK